MDRQLKERLVGAVVLVSVAVLVIPVILSGPAERASAPPAQRTPEPAAPARFSSRVVPLEPPSATPIPDKAAAAEEPAASVTPAAREPAPAAPQPEQPAPPPAAAAAAAAPRAPRSGWVVQLGSFANTRNAFALRDRLVASGYSAFAESSGSGVQAVTRVYVGPEAEREGAERQVARLLEETRLKGIVVHYPGE